MTRPNPKQERVGLMDGIHAYGVIDGAWRAAGEPRDVPVTGGRLEFVPGKSGSEGGMLKPISELEVLCRAAEDSWLGTTFDSSLAAMQARELGRGALGLAKEGRMGRAIHTARNAVALERKHLGENGPWTLFLAALEKASPGGAGVGDGRGVVECAR